MGDHRAMARAPSQLIMVYNAEGGWFAALSDAVHKIVSPATYPCSLCALTYGPVAMRNRWRRYLAGLPVEPVFLHRDEVPDEWGPGVAELPVILLGHAGGPPSILVSAAELRSCADLAALIALVDRRLGEAIPPLAQPQ